MKKYVIGIDVGTTGTKAMVVDLNGNNLGSSYRDYPFITKKDKWVELDPDNLTEQVFTVTEECIQKSGVIPEEVAAISFSVQRSSCLLVDENGEALNNIMVWLDTRADETMDEFASLISPEYTEEITGMPCNSIYANCKFFWMMKNMPEIWDKATYLSTVDGYIMKKFGNGEFCIDISSAQTGGLIDVRTMDWCYEQFDKIGISREKLPRLVKPGDIVGKVNQTIISRTGLSEDTLIVCGLGDQQAGAFGSGVINNGDIEITIGTGGFVIAGTNNPDFKKFTGIMVSTTPNLGVFEVEGIQNSGATCYRWAKETFCSIDSEIAKDLGMDAFDFMGQYVEQSCPGSNGLIFSAALFGTGYPTWNLNASGAFVGIKETHKKGDFLRAVMEGVTLEARYMLESMKEVGVDVNPVITITGGATKSPIWRQIIADVMGSTCRTLDVSDAPLIGVACLAATGAGLFETRKEAVENMVHYKDMVEPIKENVKIYNRVFDVYKKIYHSLNDNGIYDALNKLYE